MQNNSFLLAFLIFTSMIGYSQIISPPDTSETDKSIFKKVEIEAFFPGGEAAWRKFLEKNLNPNVPIDNGAPSGRYTIWVQFFVDLDGSLSDVKALTSLGYGMEREVILLIKKSGLWTPAMQNNRPVKAYRKQPVTFIVMDDQIDIESKVLYTLFTEIDNEISVTTNKVKSEDIMLTLSQGKITPKGDGKYIIKQTKPGRVIVSVYNAKKNKKIGDVSFEVREQVNEQNDIKQ